MNIKQGDIIFNTTRKQFLNLSFQLIYFSMSFFSEIASSNLRFFYKKIK